MKTERKIIVSIATSVDGYSARPDGDVAWLDRPRPKGNYGMGEFFKSIDTILWGRKTYSKGIEMGMEKDGIGIRRRHPELRFFTASAGIKGGRIQVCQRGD
jgi:RibD C-terminal domain